MTTSYVHTSLNSLRTMLTSLTEHPSCLTKNQVLEYSRLSSEIKIELNKHDHSVEKEHCITLIIILRLKIRTFFSTFAHPHHTKRENIDIKKNEARQLSFH
jgi:hypothetical protein